MIVGAWNKSGDNDLNHIRIKLLLCSNELSKWDKNFCPNNMKKIEELKKLLADERAE